MTHDHYGEAYQKGFTCTVRFLISRGVPGDAAQEVAQSAWTRGWEKHDQLRNDDMVVTWVNTIAINTYRRDLRREPHYVSVPDLRTPEMNWAAVDVGRILRLCCPRDRTLLEQQMQGLTSGEIARQEGVPTATVRVRLLRAGKSARAQIAVRRTQAPDFCESISNAA